MYVNLIPPTKPQVSAFLDINNFSRPILPPPAAIIPLDKILPNSILRFVQECLKPAFVTRAAKNSPRIDALQSEYNLKRMFYPSNITSIMRTHLLTTYQNALGIMSRAGKSFSSEDYDVMRQATLLHDVGKVFIPPPLFSMKTLDNTARALLDEHSSLGYELLKDSGLNPRVLHLIENHHNKPCASSSPDVLTQILRLADVFSALREDRPYRKAMPLDQAFKVIKEDVQRGLFGKEYFHALKAYVRTLEN